jgi:TolB-like protein/predicted Ser/Thr protein kinase
MVGQTVSHYRVIAKIGGGGMGVVYEAEDRRLHRHVALKFLPEGAAGDPAALERFKREAEAASALNNPHICTIYDIGEHAGHPFIVMEKLEGASLSELIAEHPLPTDRVLMLGAQIADALEAAHGAGIVHRDIKPANIFVTTHGDAKLLDFGVARFDAAPDSSSRVMLTDLTVPGTILGTIAYMSPEQARGETVDARSDLFSLGAVLYEMTTGQQPFRGATVALICDAILNHQPDFPSLLGIVTPRELDRLILGLLAKDRDLRVQPAMKVRSELLRLQRSGSASKTVALTAAPGSPATRRMLIAAALAASILVGGLWWRNGLGVAPSETGAPGAGAAATRIAVLPFENLGGPDEQYFAHGMTDEIRGKLASLSRLAVIARASSDQYKGSLKAPDLIAGELGVTHLLTGSIRWQKSGGTSRIRMRPELVEISGSRAPSTRWQETYDADVADVFDVQARIAAQVAQALQVALAASESKRLEERPTSNLVAYDAYLKGVEIFSRGFNPAIQSEAQDQFERAVALDPQFALAWAYLSLSRSMRYSFGTPNPELGAAAGAAAERAMALAPQLPKSHMSLGVYYRTVKTDSARAVEMLRRGLEVAPGNVDLLRNLGFAERERGRPEEALVAMRQAVDLDPRSWANHNAVADTLLSLRRSLEARRAAERGLAVNPVQLDLTWVRVVSLAQEGNLAAARAAVVAVPKEVDTPTLVAHFAAYEQSWLLDAPQRDLLLRLTPAAFDNDRAEWGLDLAHESWLRGNLIQARKHADEARKVFRAQIEASPTAAFPHAALGELLALLGHSTDAVHEGTRALQLAPSETDPEGHGRVLRRLAHIYVWVGDYEKAIDVLTTLLRTPSYVTSGLLRIDPSFDSLRGRPRFETLVSGSGVAR